MAVKKSCECIDLLGRQQFVDRLIEVATLLAERKRNACFSINGEWGAGKTFVLNMFEEQLNRVQSEDTASEKYIIIRYNCWQYDYYDEPIISIVAAITDMLDEKERIIPEEVREKTKSLLRAVGKEFLKGLTKKVDTITGLNTNNIYNIIKDGIENANDEWIKEQEYDPYFGFNQALRCLRKIIAELAERRTFVFIVDELDRCLPEYTIKILERLHHVFDEIENVQVIIATDKTQLGYVVKQIFGEKTSVKRYLAKFIDFELNLLRGEIQENIRLRYPEYFSSFSDDAYTAQEIDEYYKTILKDIDIRSCNAIIEKAHLCHQMLNDKGKTACSSMLCVEVFLSLLKYFEIDFDSLRKNSSVESQLLSPDLLRGAQRTLPGFALMAEKWKKGSDSGHKYHSYEERRNYVFCGDLFGLSLACYRLIIGNNNDYWMYQRKSKDDVKEYTLKFWRLLKLIA